MSKFIIYYNVLKWYCKFISIVFFCLTVVVFCVHMKIVIICCWTLFEYLLSFILMLILWTLIILKYTAVITCWYILFIYFELLSQSRCFLMRYDINKDCYELNHSKSTKHIFLYSKRKTHLFMNWLSYIAVLLFDSY